MEQQQDISVKEFTIAELNVRVIFNGTQRNNMSLLESLVPFERNFGEEELFFELTIDDSLKPVPKDQRQLIRDFDTGNGITSVHMLHDGGYQYIMKDIKGNDCCLLIADADFKNCRCALRGNHDMRLFGLNNALMLVYAFAGSFRQTLLIHASLVRYKEHGYAFTAKSGTGKSTHVNLWLKHIPGCDLINDDNPIIRIIDNKPYIYGSPWSGKTPCYRNIKAKLGAITRIDRASINSVDKLGPVEAFASTLPSCSTMKWDGPIFNNICDTVTKIIETTGIYILHCRPDKEAALVCNKTIAT